MTRKYSCRAFLIASVSSGILLSIFSLFSACAGSKSSEIIPLYFEPEVKVKEKAPTLTVPTHREVVYNGSPQPLAFSYDGKDVPEVMYYLSSKSREEDRGRSYAAPIRTGIYYVFVRCRDAEAYAELKIVKCPVILEAEEYQEAYYNGNPKRVQVTSTPPVPLSYSYYPNKELRDAAVKAFEEITHKGDSGESYTEIFRGYKRIERAPAEQGTYYVWIYYPGDENHEPAQTDVVFTILPPLGR